MQWKFRVVTSHSSDHVETLLVRGKGNRKINLPATDARGATRLGVMHSWLPATLPSMTLSQIFSVFRSDERHSQARRSVV